MSKYCKPMRLYVTYLDCMDCEGKECIRRRDDDMDKIYLHVKLGSIVYLVYKAKRAGDKEDIVIKCIVRKVVVYTNSLTYYCEPVKVVTKCKDVTYEQTYYMAENSNINTGVKGTNRYPIFTTKEVCIKWLREI